MRRLPLYILAAVLALPLLFSATAPQVSAVIENDTVADAMVNEELPTTNYGSTDSLYVGAGASGASESYRMWLKFDLSFIPGGTTISSARVNTYFYLDWSGGATGGIGIHFSDNDNWLENTVTWDNQPSFDSGASDSVSQFTGSGWKSWDVTENVQSQFTTDNLLSLVLKAVNEDVAGYNRPYTREYENSSLRPYLEINFVSYSIEARWETTYGLVSDGDGENAIENRGYHLTFFYSTSSPEADMTTNPEDFDAYESVRKIKLEVEPDNYWRTRIPQAEGIVDMILVDNVGDLDQYEFTLKDLTGQFGVNDNGQLWFSRYVENDFLHVHEDFWDAEDSVTAFLIYGKEYSLKLVTDTQERSYGMLTADGILTKEISVSTFTMPDSQMIWDDVGWSTWWSDNDLKVSYQDNLGETDNVTVNVYDENDNQVYTENFLTGQWTLTWAGANENIYHTVELNINHQFHGALTSTDVLLAPWTPPGEEEGGIPGIGQLGTLPFTWGAGIGIILVIAIAYTFGARHAGFCVLTIGMFLVMLGPVMGLFRLNPDPLLEWGFASFIIVMGVLMMLTKRGG